MFPEQGHEGESNPSLSTANECVQENEELSWFHPCGATAESLMETMKEERTISSKYSEGETNGEGSIPVGDEGTAHPNYAPSSNSLEKDANNAVGSPTINPIDLLALAVSPQNSASRKSPSDNVKVEETDELLVAVAKLSGTPEGEAVFSSDENSEADASGAEPKAEPRETFGEANSVSSPGGSSLTPEEESILLEANCTAALRANGVADSIDAAVEGPDAIEAKDEPAVAEKPSAAAQQSETDPRAAGGAQASQTNNEDSNGEADETGMKDEPEATETHSPLPSRGEVLRGREKADQVERVLDQVQHDLADTPEGLPGKIPPVTGSAAIASSAPILDDAGNPTEYNRNDIFLSLTDSAYKTVMYDQFQKLGDIVRRVEDTNAANEVFQRFKKTGGRFFKRLGHASAPYTEVNEEEALEKIEFDCLARVKTRGLWMQPSTYSIPRKEGQGESIPAQNGQNSSKAKTSGMKPPSHDAIPAVGRSSSRTRKRPRSFMDAQGQEMMVQDTLRTNSALARKKKQHNAENCDKLWTVNENREFEAGCQKHGWGNWTLVQLSVPSRTSQECEIYSRMIEEKFPESVDRLIDEHIKVWVYPEDRELPYDTATLAKQPEQLKILEKPPPIGNREEGATGVRKSSRAKESTWRAKEGANNRSESPIPKPVKILKDKRKRISVATEADKSGSMQSVETEKIKAESRAKTKQSEKCKHDESSIDLAQQTEYAKVGRPSRRCAINARKMLAPLDVEGGERYNDVSIRDSAQQRDDAYVGRPQRQSAINAEKKFALLHIEDESDTGLKVKKNYLFKGLPSSPSNNTNRGYYEEESAWRFHNPDFPEKSVEQLTELRNNYIPCSARTSAEYLKPIPFAPPLPQLPNTRHCKWSFDETSRVLLANFRDSAYARKKGKVKVTDRDKVFLFQMMERDDITVVSEGVADSMNPSLWTREYIEGCIGSEYHHKFRGFETVSDDADDPGKQLIKQSKEKEGWYSMKVSDYFRYLEQRQSVKKRRLDNTEDNKDSESINTFSFTDSYDKEKSVNVDNEALYMIDVDIVKLLPHAFEDLQTNFKLPGILPGGSHCMMNAVNVNGRPFMGPNLYITPPSSFTHFHQDGHGTVDSGHLCLSGYNEVVMLRRLTERHKCHAIHTLTGTSDSHGALYGLPHRDGLTSQLDWPSMDAIYECEEMGYHPSVFILRPGQVVHINKGRLHAFRKLAPTILDQSDCHFKHRNKILQTKEEPMEDICFSIAWDWMFKGVTSEGINREVSGILECARLNREHGLPSLAIPETTLIFLAKENIAKHQLESKVCATNSLFAMNFPLRPTRSSDGPEPDAETVLRGILPSLQYVISRHDASVNFSKEWEEKTKGVLNSWRVSIDSRPNTREDPGTFALDPYGAGDFFCKFCHEELGNVYMHCDGCEKLLNKDFNICSSCHMEGKYKAFHQMHPFNPKPQSILNHTGNKTQLRQARCPCKNGKECKYCSYCTGCSCRCHQWFTLHHRFMGLENELEILQNAKRIVGSNELLQTAETKARLISLISGDVPQEEEVIPKTDVMLCPVLEANNRLSKTKSRHLAITAGTSLKKEEMKIDQVVIKELATQPIEGKAIRAVSAVGEGKNSTTSGFNGDSRAETNMSSKAKGKRKRKPSATKTTTTELALVVKEKMADCNKCQKEIETGRRSRKPHSDHCPWKSELPTMSHDSSSAISDLLNEEEEICPKIATDFSVAATEMSKARVQSKKKQKMETSQVNGVATEINSASEKGGGSRVNDDICLPLPPHKIDAQNESVQENENSMVANQSNVGNHCPKFGSNSDAPGASTAQKNRKRLQPDKDEAEEKVFSQDSTEVSVNESTTEANILFDLDKLKRGSRVIVQCERKIDWQATIRKRREKKGKQGFMIHYKGAKSNREKWVPNASVLGFSENNS